MELIFEPWPWYVAGPGIALVMFLLLYLGKSLGVSANLRTMCSIGGAGKFADFFRFDWKKQIWNLGMVVGLILGGFVSSQYLTKSEKIDLNPKTVAALEEIGISNAGEEYLPDELFSTDLLYTWKGWLILVGGGILVGFGSRYAGGCTSGHAISGLSNLQVPSLIAVIGFFIGGLLMTHLILPFIF